MKVTGILSFSAIAALAAWPACGQMVKKAGTLPDVVNVNVKNLTPEDGVYDFSRKTLYQSNLWKGLISTFKPSDGSHINVKIDGVSSSGNGQQQMAGLSLDSRENPTKLYAVAKPADAFRFDAVHDQGPCSFHMFNLPLSETSKPVFSVDMTKAQDAHEKKYGTRPYGNVASAQDKDGNSYVIFALGAPAITKISADGSTFEAWYQEKSNGNQRPGYTGVAYVPEANAIVAFGGPRPLTLFRLSNATPSGETVQLTGGSFGSLDGTEKLKAIPSIGANKSTRLVGAKSPYIYSFASSDNWKTATFKRAKRSEFTSAYGLTSIVEYGSLSLRGIYGTGAFFGNGARGGRTNYPAYRISRDLLL